MADNDNGRDAKILPFNRREKRNSDERVLSPASSVVGELNFGKEILANKEKAEKLARDRARANISVLKSYRMKK